MRIIIYYYGYKLNVISDIIQNVMIEASSEDVFVFVRTNVNIIILYRLIEMTSLHYANVRGRNLKYRLRL